MPCSRRQANYRSPFFAERKRRATIDRLTGKASHSRRHVCRTDPVPSTVKRRTGVAANESSSEIWRTEGAATHSLAPQLQAMPIEMPIANQCFSTDRMHEHLASEFAYRRSDQHAPTSASVSAVNSGFCSKLCDKESAVILTLARFEAHLPFPKQVGSGAEDHLASPESMATRLYASLPSSLFERPGDLGCPPGVGLMSLVETRETQETAGASLHENLLFPGFVGCCCCCC